MSAHHSSRRLLCFLLAIIAVLGIASAQCSAASGQRLTVSPGNLDFQTVALGQQAALSFEFKNTGSTTLHIYKVSSSKGEFQVAGPSLPVSLAPGDDISFKMIFEPTAMGKTSALLEIVSSAQAMQSYTLTGTGKESAAALQVSPASLNFGSRELNSLSTKTITVTNVGDSPLTISGVTVMGSGFSFSKVSPGLSLAPKEQTTLQVSFRPTSSEVASGKVTILSKNLAVAATLPLAGSGVSASPVRAAAFSAAAEGKAAALAARSTVSTEALVAPIAARSATAKSPAVAALAPAVAASSASTVHPALASSSTPQTVQLQWGASSSAVTGYKVYRGTTDGGPYALQTGAIPTLSYNDTAVTAGTSYYYVVTSVDAQGVESTFSNEASATLPTSGTTTPPPPPTTPPPTPAPAGSVPTALTTGIILNGSATLDGTRLRLTSTAGFITGSGWFQTPVNVQSFSNDFTFQIANTTASPTGNGIAFVIQNTGTRALGPTGGGLGYGPDHISNPTPSSRAPIGNSIAIKFDTVNNAGEGTNSTGLYKNGASPTMPAVTVGNGVNLRSGDIFQVHMGYDGTTLSMTITDTRNTSETFATSWPIDIPGTVGGNTAFVGFTGATGNSVADQDVITWTYTNTATSKPTSTPTTKTPIVYRSTTLPAVSSGPTFRTFSYSGFPDTNGTILDATAAGDNVTFTVNIPAAGTYDIKLSYKQNTNRSISQLTINGASVGAPLDQYLPVEGYATFDYGKFIFPVVGKYSFTFTVLGEDASAYGYAISFDDFTLTPQ